MRKKVDHVIIFGLGSIGWRHLKHLRSLGVQRIDAYRTGKARITDPNGMKPDNTYTSTAHAFADNPDAIIVSNPTSLHLETAKMGLSAGASVLVEKPLSDSAEGCEELVELAERKSLVLAIGCNLRFHPLLLKVKEIVNGQDLGKPLHANAYFVDYFPSWHPWEDYHDSYVAQEELGGGAALTHVHEIDYLLWLFGYVEDANGFVSPEKPLNTNVDEVTCGSLKHSSGVISTINLSISQSPRNRGSQIFFENGYVSIDLDEGKILIDESDKPSTTKCLGEDFDMDDTYKKQDKAFLSSVSSKTMNSNLCTGEDALNALRAVDLIKNS